MGPMPFQLDQHTLDRLEALSLLRREAGRPADPDDLLRHALSTGLDTLLRDLLARPARATLRPSRRARA